MNPEKHLSEQGREQTTNSTRIMALDLLTSRAVERERARNDFEKVYMASTLGCVSALTTAPPLLSIKSIETVNNVACE